MSEDFLHRGEDGWLFLAGGANAVAQLYDRCGGRLPDDKLRRWVDRFERRARRARRLGAQCLHVVAPDKFTIYDHRQGSPRVDGSQAPAMRLRDWMSQSREQDAYLDLVQPLRAQRDQRDLYWRTDTHWTPEGCLLAYETICRRLGVEPLDDLLERPHYGFSASLDLGARLDPPAWEYFRRYDFIRLSRRVWSNRVTQFLEDPAYREQIHVGARTRYVNDQARDARSILLVGDSYSGPGVGGLTAMLAETFRSVEFLWWASIPWGLVRRRRPDVLLWQTAERFLLTPQDDSRLLAILEARQNWRARQLVRANS